MDKVIVMVRTSTDKQSTEEQHKEMEEFCIQEGWSKDSIVWVEEQGASAAKVDDTYRAMIDQVKSHVEAEPDIKCFAVWHLNRLARTEEVWVEVKKFFVSRKIQIICKNPYLKLLTPSGDVDQGIELAMGLLAILSKQDNEERKAKFKRAKTAMLKKGQYIGGHTIKYGYKVEDKNFVVDEEQAKVVRTIFDLYSTGRYSVYTLSNELSERGMPVSSNIVQKTISCKAYIGEEVGEFGLHYPPIISKELFDKCAEIRNGNKIEMKRGERIVLGAKLVKCPVCGGTCTSNSRHYVCSRHVHHGPCDNGFALRHCVADELLWRIASTEHLQYLVDMNENKTEEYKKQLEVIDEKIAAAEIKISDFQKKKDRIIDSYLEGLIDRNKRDSRLLNVEDDIKVHKGTIAALQDKRRAIVGLLETKVDDIEAFEAAVMTMDAEDKFDIIHQHIVKLTAKQESFGKRDPRTTRPNGVRIEIQTTLGATYTFMYVPKFYLGSNLFQLVRGKWHMDYVEITDKAINTKKKKED